MRSASCTTTFLISNIKEPEVLSEVTRMTRYPEIVERLLELVTVEQYSVAGVVGDLLLVAAFREGSVNLYLFDGVNLVRVSRTAINGYAKPPRGARRIVFYRDVSRGRELHKLYYVDLEKPSEEAELHPEQKPQRILGVAQGDSRIVYTGVHERGVGVYLVEGNELSKITDLPGLGWISKMSGDIAVGLGVFPPDMRFFKLFTVDLSSGKIKIHEPPTRGNIVAFDITREENIVYGVEGAREARLYELDPESGRSRELELGANIRKFKPTSFNEVKCLKGGLAIIARRSGRSRLFVDDEPIDLPEGIHTGVDEWRDGLVVTHTSKTVPPRILIATHSGWRVLLEGKKPRWVDDVISRVGFVEVVNKLDGSRVPTLYLENKLAPKPGPTVVLVHGGPFAEDMDVWDVFALALAATGFHVVQPNYRGSLGYGVEWTEKIIGDPCGMELEDVVSAGYWARESGLASSIYIMGYSYGGYLTLCALTRKPGAFKAGIAGASVADWELMYELSDPAFRGFIEMLFSGRRELWRERSPITYVGNLRDPLLLIHPQNDSRTPLKPILKFMEEASDKGKSIEAYIAPDMGHVVNNVRDALKILLPALLFLARLEESESRVGAG